MVKGFVKGGGIGGGVECRRRVGVTRAREGGGVCGIWGYWRTHFSQGSLLQIDL